MIITKLMIVRSRTRATRKMRVSAHTGCGPWRKKNDLKSAIDREATAETIFLGGIADRMQRQRSL